MTDPTIRQQAVQAVTYTPRERYILFVLFIESAFMNVYSESGPNVRRWQAADGNA